MRVLVALSAHFGRYRGRLYSPDHGYERFWSRYLSVFDEVLILARVRDIDELEAGMCEATGPGVDYAPLPDYYGPWQYLAVRRRFKPMVTQAVDRADAFVLRLSSTSGTLAWRELRRRRWPYAVEVVGDPWLSFAPGSIRTPIRPLARRIFPMTLRRQCYGAIAASYVTQTALQRSYPPHPTAYTIGCSTIELPDASILEDLAQRMQRIATIPRRLHAGPTPVRIGFIGTFNVMYKAPDVHIEALDLCRRRGLNVEMVMIGDGAHREEMSRLVARKGLADRIRLPGRLPAGMPILEFLDGVDLFLNASRQEGLPRALIEAMARGCPAIGSDIAGIPELLPPPSVVPADDAAALADCIAQVLSDEQGLQRAAERNRDKAREYRSSVLNVRRRAFYEYVRQRTLELRTDRGESEPSAEHTTAHSLIQR